MSVTLVGVAATPAQAQTISSAEAADLAAAHSASSAVANARAAATGTTAKAASVTNALKAADAAVIAPDTDNANGHVCHWYGYCDFRLSDSRADQLVDLLNVGAGATALCAVIGAASGGVATVGCGAVSALLWTASGWISYLVDHYHRGIFIRVFYTGGGYIWHQ